MFISFANSSLLPAIYSASATAASFPDLINKPYSNPSTVILSSFFSPSLDPPVPAAFESIVTISDKSLQFSSTTIAVIILVVDAIAVCLFSSFPYILNPCIPIIYDISSRI